MDLKNIYKIVSIVKDISGQEESTTLNITIMDVDDLSPRFLRKPSDDVIAMCDVTVYTAEIGRHFQVPGLINWYKIILIIQILTCDYACSRA